MKVFIFFYLSTSMCGGKQADRFDGYTRLQSNQVFAFSLVNNSTSETLGACEKKVFT